MDDYVAGGQQTLDIFRCRKKSTNDGYDVFAGMDGEVAASSPDDAAFSLTLFAGVKPQNQEDGTVKISVDNYQDNPDFFEFLEKANPPKSTGALKETVMENGSKIGGSGSSDTYLFIDYGGDYQISSGNYKEKVLAAFGAISKTSGSYQQVAEDFSKPTFEIVGNKVSSLCDLTIPAGILRTGVGKLLDATDAAAKINKIPKNAGYIARYVFTQGSV